jgi:glutamate-5-semialdehyde dehydrogenase
MNISDIGKQARAASRQLARAASEQKNAALLRLAGALFDQAGEILAANARDVAAGQSAGLSPALLDRLTLNPSRLAGVAADLRGVAALPDPVGEIFDEHTLPNGLRVRKQRVPLGVLGVIYESRPNVTVDVAGLALKTGNAAILRGGSETLHTNRALVAVIRQAIAAEGLPADSVQFIDDPDRARVTELLNLHQYIDMLIPRGGPALHDFCRENSRIPVITGGIGICHLYVDQSADLEAALEVIRNAKVQRPTVCNALDTVLVHQSVAAGFLPRLVAHLAEDSVSFRAAPSAWPYLLKDQTGASSESEEQLASGAPVVEQVLPGVNPAGPQDFDTEWLSLILGLKVVSSLDEAIDHIAAHSTGHSDGILTSTETCASRFVAEIDSAAVYVNASTRFTDGGQLGLGAEVAISTQRLHARGPMGLRELTTYKWVIIGDHHIRA